MKTAKLGKASFKWHRKLAWAGLFAVLMFVVSGLTHPILSWTGPQAAKFRPPTASIQPQQVALIPKILKQHGVEQAIVAKLLPSKNGVVLQVTQNPKAPRRYFNLETKQELANYDQQHAAWLAQYYVGGESERAIKSIDYQTEFNSAYPWVNRLLPVYKVNFADDANTSIYIYTEINAMAGMGNDYKTRLQAVFRNLHTWSWLDGVDGARIIIMAMMLITVIILASAGVGLLVLLRGRKNIPIKAKVHRVTAYVVALPLLAFSISGFWHLLHYGFTETKENLKLGAPISLSDLSDTVDLEALPDTPLNQVSVMQHNGELLYRLSVPSKRPSKEIAGGEHAHHNKTSDVDKRIKRFKGQAKEQGGLYYSASTGNKVDVSDKQLAINVASQQLGIDQSKVRDTQLVKRFGTYYDFRNKRLPVWQIDFDSTQGDKVFIDPATGILVDSLINKDRYESYSFSLAHKWNFLTPFMGRFWRDVLVVIILSLILVVSLLGLMMKLRR